MSTTLLFIGDDRDVRADLAFVPPEHEVARVDTIAAARAYLADTHPSARHLIAYGANFARSYQDSTPDSPLGDGWGPRIVLTHGDTHDRDYLWRGVVKLGVEHVVSLPLAWWWLLDALAAPADAHLGPEGVELGVTTDGPS